MALAMGTSATVDMVRGPVPVLVVAGPHEAPMWDADEEPVLVSFIESPCRSVCAVPSRWVRRA